jgi:hypothetical protein
MDGLFADRALVKAFPMVALTALICAAVPPPAEVVGSVSSPRPLAIDNVSMSPTGSASWPVVEGDEIATEAPALFTTTDRDVVTFDANSNARVSRVQAKEAYVFVRKGGLAFDAKSTRLMICIGSHLFVPQPQAKGTLRLETNGTVSEHLDGGAFAEEGKRGCGETGPVSIPGGLGGAAGAVIPAAGAHAAGAAVGTAATVAIAAGGSAAVAGSAFAAGSSSTVSLPSCATAGCNTLPAPVSTVQP